MRVPGNSFRPQNVTSVPSLLGQVWCQMGQVQATGPNDRSRASKEEANEQAARGRQLSQQVGIENRGKMKIKDSNRKWMWWFLGVVLALQLYFVRELLAAFALFALGFAAIAFVVV